jgi:hypothetical protein
MLAEWMRKEEAAPEKRDPAAPEPQARELTRRIGDSDKQHLDAHGSDGYTVEVADDANAGRRKRAADLIDRARAFMDAGALRAAAGAAQEALVEADQAEPPGIIEVIEPARPMLARIFAGFVGPLSEVPTLERPVQNLDLTSFDERSRAVLGRVDGARTLGQIFDDARIPAFDALRLAARLIRDGVLRVV